MSMEISAVLDQMRSVRVAAGSDGVNLPTRLEAPVDFSNLLKESLTEVSKVQKASGDLSLAYASGDDSVDLVDVMVTMQKASLSFEAVVQVRNKVLSAYQEVMNMSI